MSKEIYHRNCRIFTDGQYTEGGRWKYIVNPEFSKSPEQYIRAFMLIQKDLQTLFEYVEPADINLNTYSYRIHELLMRTCIEVEANFKAIFLENTYTKKEKDWNINDYKKINQTHKLSSFEVKMPVWHGTINVFKPFDEWRNNGSLAWYKAYNDTKHDRHNKFSKANFSSLLNAVCGLLVLLSSQFHTEEFSSASYFIMSEGSNDKMESAMGSYFRIKFPTKEAWADAERYEFTAREICDNQYKIGKIDYDKI